MRAQKVSLGDSNNDRQPEMAAETGNTHISLIQNAIEILAANPALSTMASWIKVSRRYCDNDR